MTYLLSILIFAAAVAIKGGWLGKVFTNWQRLVNRVEASFEEAISSAETAWHNRAYKELFKSLFVLPFKGFAKWFLDGSVISLFIVFFYVAASQPSLTVAILAALGWCLIWSSMGEEAGAAGDYKGAWGEYVEARNPDGELAFNRSYGIKKGIQYGAFFGGVMSMAVGSWCIWIAAMTFPLCYFLGSSLQRYISDGKIRGWQYAEPLYGAVVGLGYALAISGYLPI